MEVDDGLSPWLSVAGVTITGHAVHGWHFWRFRKDAGEWVPLDVLRRN
jgi:hypothetical protein